MARRLKKTSNIDGEEVIAGDSRKNRRNGNGYEPDGVRSNIPNPWDHTPVNFSDIDKILNFPGIEDMAGVLARGNFKKDDERIAFLRVIRRLKKFLDTVPQKSSVANALEFRLEFVRECVASTNGMMAFGKMLQLQSKVELIAPAVIREQLAMTKLKSGEETVRRSDFRQETQDQEPRA